MGRELVGLLDLSTTVMCEKCGVIEYEGHEHDFIHCPTCGKKVFTVPELDGNDIEMLWKAFAAACKVKSCTNEKCPGNKRKPLPKQPPKPRLALGLGLSLLGDVQNVKACA